MDKEGGKKMSKEKGAVEYLLETIDTKDRELSGLRHREINLLNDLIQKDEIIKGMTKIIAELKIEQLKEEGKNE